MNATITRWQRLTDSLAIFTVTQDKPYETFTPGQYCVLGLNHGDTSISRAYSLGSAPESVKQGLEFYVRRVGKPKGDIAFTHLLFDCKEGDRIWTSPKPRGHFTLEGCVGENDPRLQVFIAAGTGLAPFVSMVTSHALRLNGRPDPRHVVLHGARHTTDLGYRDEMQALLNRDGRVRYVASLSQPEPHANWTGPKGRIETHLEPGKIESLEAALGLEAGFLRPENAVIYICGLQGTIATVLTHMFSRGYVPHETKLRHAFHIPKDTHASIFFEQYDSDPIMDLADATLVESMRERLRSSGVRLQAPAESAAAESGAGH